jgi:hypothetical protein
MAGAIRGLHALASKACEEPEAEDRRRSCPETSLTDHDAPYSFPTVAPHALMYHPFVEICLGR